MNADDIKPDLGLSYLEAGRGNATFTFTRLTFSMIGRVGEGLYTMIATLPMEQTYALSIDFDESSYEGLLALLPGGAKKQLKKIFSGPFSSPPGTVDVPRGAICCGVRAELGEPQRNDDESYAPFVALEFLAPAEHASLYVED
jgi:hypothetical protein